MNRPVDSLPDGSRVAGERFDLLAVEVFSWPTSLATAVEICLRRVAQGQRVGFVFLDIPNIDEVAAGKVEELLLWQWIPRLQRRTRRARVAKMEEILRAHGVTVIKSPHASSSTPVPSCRHFGIDSIESLQEFRFDGAPLGLGITSSLIRHMRTVDPDFEQSRDLIDHLLKYSIAAFDLARIVIRRFEPAAVLVYNGRLACSKAIVEAARSEGAEVLYHEIGATHERFYLSNRPPQSTVNARAMLQESWANAGPDRESVGASFFTRGRAGEPLWSKEFGRKQIPGRSISRVGGRRIVYFASSDDEHAAVEEGLEHFLFESQRAAAAWLADWVRARPSAELVIRVHPRMGRFLVGELAWWDSLAGGNVTIVPADSPVDSYALAASADVVICYRTTVGAEATYMGKTSILLGDSIYRGLDCVYEPQTLAELEGMLQDLDLPPKPRENCLPFGYDRMTKGTPYRFYRPASLSEGAFFGERVTLPTPLTERIGIKLSAAGGRWLRVRKRRWAGRRSK